MYQRVPTARAGLLLAALLGLVAPVTVEAATAPGPATPKVEAGECGPDSLPETGLQGQVPQADQRSGRAQEGYRCNLALVGQTDIGGRGANFQLAWLDRCAYVGMVGQGFQSPFDPVEEGTPSAGVAVVDVSDPRAPQVVGLLQSGVGGYQHEGIETHAGRGMLVVQIGGVSAQWIEIWDISQDCRTPVFRGRYDSGRARYHGLRISPDGRTIYATNTFPDSEGLHAIDVTDMANPRLVAAWNPGQSQLADTFGIHDLELSPDGKRAYLGVIPLEGYGSLAKGPCCHVSLVILDVSQIEERRPSPVLPVVATLGMDNFGHTIQYGVIDGKPHLFVSGENPFVGEPHCPWAWGHVVDISDETAPRKVSDIRLEVNDPAQCPITAQDETNYSVHYIGVDDVQDTTTVFYTYYGAGLRVFDVREPSRPHEIAYYHPLPLPTTGYAPKFPPPGRGFDAQTPAWDAATSVVRYLPQTGEIWFVSVAAGFQVLRFTGDGGPSAPVPADNPPPSPTDTQVATPTVITSPAPPRSTLRDPNPAPSAIFGLDPQQLYVCSLRPDWAAGAG